MGLPRLASYVGPQDQTQVRTVVQELPYPQRHLRTLVSLCGKFCMVCKAVSVEQWTKETEDKKSENLNKIAPWNCLNPGCSSIRWAWPAAGTPLAAKR